MKHNEALSKIMSTELQTVQVGQKLSEARRLLLATAIGHVPVLDGETLVGMLSSGDILRLTYDAGNVDPRTIDAVLDNTFSLDKTMTRDLTTMQAGDTIRQAAELLVASDFHAIPIVDEGQKLVGIVTSTDLIRYLLEQY